MGLSNPLPIGPGPRSKFDPIRESDTLGAINEIRAKLSAVIAKLAPYSARTLTDATNGRMYSVLGAEAGMRDVAELNTQPFGLNVVNTGTGAPAWKIRVNESTIAGGTSADLGFVEGYLHLVPNVGKVFGKVTISASTGDITGRNIEAISASMPSNTVTDFYVQIGSVWKDEADNWQVSNVRYGPIDAYVCRLWYRATAPFYVVYWQ